MVDRLAILLERFAVTASVFHAGALCGINTLDGEDEAGQLHLVRRGPLQVSHGQQTVQVQVPSLLLYPRPMPHRFSTDPQQGADMACANLHFEGGRLNPISAALPDFICLPLADLYGGNAALELLFEEAFEQRCGRAAMVNRLFEVVMIQVLRQLMEGGEMRGGLFAGLGHPRLRLALVAMHEAPARSWTPGRPGRGCRHVTQRVRRQLPRGDGHHAGPVPAGLAGRARAAGPATGTAAEADRR